jgi:hypothetical protein
MRFGRRHLACASCALGLVLLGAGLSLAQPSSDESDRPAGIVGINGPPPPVPPDVVARDENGRVTMRAVRLEEPLTIDGRLDEAVYLRIPPVSDFIQQEPHEGEPATEQTDLWVFYDDRNVYVTGRMWDSQPDRIVANEMRRNNMGIVQNDNFSVGLDTYYNQRTGFYFLTNPLGGLREGQIADEGQVNYDWLTVWTVQTSRFAQGWIAEFVIPFKSLRYEGAGEQVWGINCRRTVRWKNEVSTLSPVPASYGYPGVTRLSTAATLVGIEPPPNSRNIELKPYLISKVLTDRLASPALENDLGGEVGFDAKYGLTRSLIADFTYNTDFAQVEADEQQVNLTRFSLFFPEKREFFLENQGTFAFGGNTVNGTGDTPILFYSRRIGLNAGLPVAIDVGGRLTGRAGRYSLGLLNIRTADAPASQLPATSFSVVRVKRDVLRRSSLGVLYTGRSVGQDGGGRNSAYGVDGVFNFFNFLTITSYWARTHTAGLTSGDDTSYRTQLDYAGDRYGLQLGRLAIGSHFNPDVGYVRRADIRRSNALFRFSPRMPTMPSIRKLSWTGSVAYVEDGSGRLDSREQDAEFAVEFENADRVAVSYTDAYEFIPRPFRIATNVVVPVGGYDAETVALAYNTGPQRTITGNLRVEHGTFYGGHRTALSATRGRVSFGPRLSVEPSYSVNWVDVAAGSFTTHLLGSRVTHTMTPKMFASALLQYNSGRDVIAANVRLRWEYRPGSELFVVYNDERDTRARGFPELATRSLIVKINRLVRF